MFVTADQLLAHLVGDYIIQSDWMANEKTKKSVAALAHAASYTLPFLFLTTSWKSLLVIAGTHFIIDRWRLARYVVWAKNWIQPKAISVYAVRCNYCDHEVVKTAHAPHRSNQTDVDGWMLVGRGTAFVAECSDTCPHCCAKYDQPVIALRFVRNHQWQECSATGYHEDRPPWLSVWLLIIADNTLHLICNAVALRL